MDETLEQYLERAIAQHGDIDDETLAELGKQFQAQQMPAGATEGMLPASTEAGDPAVGPFKQPQPAERVLRQLGGYVKDHPIEMGVTAGGMALGLPLAGRAAAWMMPGRPAVANAVTKVGQALNNPATAGVMGGAAGAYSGKDPLEKMERAATGAALGYGSAKVIGGGLEKLGAAIRPKPPVLTNPASRLQQPPMASTADPMAAGREIEKMMPVNPNRGGQLVKPPSPEEEALRELLAEGSLTKWTRSPSTGPAPSPEGVTDPTFLHRQGKLPKVAPYKGPASAYHSDAPRGDAVPSASETMIKKMSQPPTQRAAVQEPPPKAAEPPKSDTVNTARMSQSKDKSPIPGYSWNDLLDEAQRLGITVDKLVEVKLGTLTNRAGRATANYGRAKAGAEASKQAKKGG